MPMMNTMAEQIFYMRGYPRRLPETMLEDLKTLLGIDGPTIDKLANAIANCDGFLDPASLNCIVDDIVTDAEGRKAARRVIFNLEIDAVPGLLRSIESILEEEPDDFPLEKSELDGVKRVLERLLKPAPALRRYRKASQLATLTGQELEDIQLICDLRPVFDESRESVEGLIPYTRLHVQVAGADGLPRMFEAELSAQQVTELAQKAEKAVKKLAKLRGEAQEWAEYGVPDLPFIRTTEEE